MYENAVDAPMAILSHTVLKARHIDTKSMSLAGRSLKREPSGAVNPVLHPGDMIYEPTQVNMIPANAGSLGFSPNMTKLQGIMNIGIKLRNGTDHEMSSRWRSDTWMVTANAVMMTVSAVASINIRGCEIVIPWYKTTGIRINTPVSRVANMTISGG